MSQNKIFFIVSILVIVLSIVCASYVTSLYTKIINHPVHMGLVGGCYDCFTAIGFIMALSFFCGLLFFGFLKHSRIKIAVFCVLALSLFVLLTGDGEGFITTLAFGVAGLILGQAVYWVRRALVKKQTPPKV